MLQKFQNPLLIGGTTSAALMIIGTAMGWFTLGFELASELAEAELASRETAAYTVGLLSIIVLGIAAAINKHRVAFVATVMSLYGTVMVYNQLPESAARELFDIQVNIGFWMAVFGGLATVIISAVIGVRGFMFMHATAPGNDELSEK